MVISVDGLQPEHDRRRSPATYDRILKNIQGRQVTVHCTITAQMMQRSGYLGEFLNFWTARDEVKRVWFSLFTPQVGDECSEILSSSERARAIEDMGNLRAAYPKLDMPIEMIRQFSTPPNSPDECVFARTTKVISADLRSEITPCQFGGKPDCSACGCAASMGLAAIAEHKLAGFIPIGLIFKSSLRIGEARLRRRRQPAPEDPLKVLQ